MTTRYDRLAYGEYFHIYNRGADKRLIFKDESDYERFVELLFLANSSDAVNIRNIRRDYSNVFDCDRGDLLVHIGAYCLMPNHFHILLTPSIDQGVEKFMMKLGTGYSMYFNKRYERKGTLYQGTYKSRHADSDMYLKYLFSYIHLNPVKLIQSDWKDVGIRDVEGAKKFLNGYPHSSLHDWFGDRTESKILSPEKFPEYFASKQEIDSEILEWLTYRELVEDLK
jgi:putative transposase